MDFVLNARFIAGLVVGVALYMLWTKKQGAAQ